MKLGFLLIIFVSINALADVQFLKGHIFANGAVQYTTDTLKNVDFIVCESKCSINIDGEIFKSDFPVFGYYSSVRHALKKELLTDTESHSGSITAQPSQEELDNSEESKEEDIQEPVVEQQPPKEKTTNYETPYPKANTVFINSAGGRLVIYPIQSCASSVCSLSVTFSNGKKENYPFKQGDRPHVELFIGKEFLGIIFWTYEGDGRIEGRIEIQSDSPENLAKALADNFNIEYLY